MTLIYQGATDLEKTTVFPDEIYLVGPAAASASGEVNLRLRTGEEWDEVRVAEFTILAN